MNFNNSTEKLLMKRSLPLFAVILLISQVFFKLNIQLFFGVTIGYAVSLIRLRSLSEMVTTMISNAKIKFGSVVIKYLIVQLLTVIVLFVAAGKSIQSFFVVFLGLSIVTLTIMINAFTEAIGITKNNFE